jgi:hypothetical protein
VGRNLVDQISSPRQPPAQFPAGKFVAPHGACFDHEGNIFVVEWVEVGRVTKLRRLDRDYRMAFGEKMFRDSGTERNSVFVPPSLGWREILRSVAAL